MRRVHVKAILVVTLMAGLGWFAGVVKSRPVTPAPDETAVMSETFAVNGTTSTVTQTATSGAGAGVAVADDQFHSSLSLDDANYGGPGELAVHGTYEIRQPNPAGSIDDREYTIVVCVRDSQNNTIVDHEPVGTVVDRVGVGHWKKDFKWAKSFLPGKYYVEMAAVTPGTEVTRFNGTIGPAFAAYSSIYAIVE